jgi:hypothetical protein
MRREQLTHAVTLLMGQSLDASKSIADMKTSKASPKRD